MENKIKSTKNYKLFSLNKKNRKVDYKKVLKLAEAMKNNNLLHLFPIVVDENNAILDGQHRFEAAKEINAEIFYLVSDGSYKMENVAESNNLQSHWKVEDYVVYYASSEDEHYKKLLHLSMKYSTNVGIVATLEGTGSPHILIREGKFTFKDAGKIDEILKWAFEIKNKYKFSHWNKRSFLRALRYLSKGVNGFDKKIFMKALDQNPQLLVKCYEESEYLTVFEEIYNKTQKTPIRLR